MLIEKAAEQLSEVVAENLVHPKRRVQATILVASEELALLQEVRAKPSRSSSVP
jgi:hypothetical protein